MIYCVIIFIVLIQILVICYVLDINRDIGRLYRSLTSLAEVMESLSKTVESLEKRSVLSENSIYIQKTESV